MTNSIYSCDICQQHFSTKFQLSHHINSHKKLFKPIDIFNYNDFSIFNQSKYSKIYFNIIIKALNRSELVIGEKHHILPKSLGGVDYFYNLALLTPREHFLCHYLLIKMVEPKSKEFYKMTKAFNMMKSSSDSHLANRYFNSHLYDSIKKHLKEAQSLSQSGTNNSNFGKVWINNPILKKSKSISESELDLFLNQGWIKGRVLNFDKKPKSRKIKPKKIIVPNAVPLPYYSIIKNTRKLLFLDNETIVTYDHVSDVKILLNDLINNQELSPNEINIKYNLGYKNICSFSGVLTNCFKIKLKNRKDSSTIRANK